MTLANMRGMLLANSKRLFTDRAVQLFDALDDLRASSLVLRTEWLHPRNGANTRGQPVRSGASASPGLERVIQKDEPTTPKRHPLGSPGQGAPLYLQLAVQTDSGTVQGAR